MEMLNHNLYLFLTAAECRSFTAAAEKLHISQPAVSKAVKTLEQELSVTLFVRDKREGLTLTRAGRELLRTGHELTLAENKLHQRLSLERQTLAGQVRVACLPGLTAMVLAQVLASFSAKYPQVVVDLIEGDGQKVRQSVSSCQADFGLLTEPFGTLDQETLFIDKFTVLALRDPKAPADLVQPLPAVNIKLSSERFVIPAELYPPFAEKVRQAGRSQPACIQIHNILNALSLVQSGLRRAIALRHINLPSAQEGLIFLPTDPEINCAIGVICRDFKELPPASQALLTMIRTVFARFQQLA